jgi:hypothetical protein
MPISHESIENFRRGILGDSFLGIVHVETTPMMYLALAGKPDEIPRSRYSVIGGTPRPPLEAWGGHAKLAGWVGIAAEQVARGRVIGKAFGFSLKKTGVANFNIATFRSGFNGQYPGPKPRFAQRDEDGGRTLSQEQILHILLPELTGGLMGATRRRASI